MIDYEKDKKASEKNVKRVPFEGKDLVKNAKALNLIELRFPDLLQTLLILKVFGWTSMIMLLQRHFRPDYRFKVLLELKEFIPDIVNNWVPFSPTVWKAWLVLEEVSNFTRGDPTNADALDKLDFANDNWGTVAFLARRIWETKMGIEGKVQATYYYAKILEWFERGMERQKS